MSDNTLRLIEVVLDRSGSMNKIKADTEGGLRAFLDQQRANPGRTLVSLHTFDDRYETVYADTPLADVPDFTLQPRGATALLDAVGRTIATAHAKLAAMPAVYRPSEVIVVILTDGHENVSREYSGADIKRLVTEQEKVGWIFLYLSAHLDAFDVAGGMGIRADTVVVYDHDRSEEALGAAGAMVSRGTRSGKYAFSDEERTATRHN
ncbi:vWA domain-containing protein [Nonomuraea sp. LPB2021202275-12-8]|uniref:vWA domain-containing protein n=1 Tax=Nonomuraea sp. LPB2021202275-12-8 TaxID=3120159 RepID=UPI00300D9C41